MTLSVVDAASEVPERPALVIGGRVVTFDELASLVRARTVELAASGLPSGDRSPTWMIGSSKLESLVQFYSFVELRQPVALLHPKLNDEERTPFTELFRKPRAAPDEEPPEVPIDDETGLAIVFTSGTTGTPKGVVLSRRAFLASARASAENIGWQDDDRWLLGLPIAHVGGLSILTRCLIGRRTVVVPSEVATGERLDAKGLARTIGDDRVTLVSLVPTQLEQLLSMDRPFQPPPHLRAVLLGGAPARPGLLERAADIGLPVLTTYGLTEACSQVATQPVGTINRGSLGAGVPLTGTEVRLGDGGAIEIRGPTLLSGYFPAGLPPLDADGWFRTDDVGRFDERGMLHLIGRRSDRIITGGENVFPAEIEAVLEACPSVLQACVFGVPDDEWGEVLAAAVVPAGDPDIEALVAFAEGRLSSHRRPRLVAFVDALRSTDGGKLDRHATAALARARLQRVRYSPAHRR